MVFDKECDEMLYKKIKEIRCNNFSDLLNKLGAS